MTHRWGCIIGAPVKHSLSPALHNAVFAARGIDAHYEAREVSADALGAALNELREPTCLGANVTAPYKAPSVPFMDSLSDEARLLGVVNTIVSTAGRLHGDNTDALGLQRWLEAAQVPVAGGATIVLGAGGAARATVLALTRLGAASIRVLNRTPDKAERLVADLPHATLSWGCLDEAAVPPNRPVAVVVNATSLSHHGAAPVVDPGWYSRDTVAIDLVYNPPRTGFMEHAEAAGARAENGLGMLIHQAILVYERWIGESVPARLYEDAANQVMAARV